MTTRLALDYVELSTPDLPAITAFPWRAFGRSFNDYGPDCQEFCVTGQPGGPRMAVRSAG